MIGEVVLAMFDTKLTAYVSKVEAARVISELGEC